MHAHGDEGMWLFNEPPRTQLKTKYQVELSYKWLDHAMKANVRFNSGGSGSFVSKDGLIVTNHHIAADALQKLSTKDRDLFALGFLARKQADELKCPDLELNVLQKIDDVTDKVNDAVKAEMKSAEAAAARRKIMTEIEAEASKTGLRADVVTLYQGGAYHLYQYRKYTDVRLVFAPEASIAAFGGDVDNFEFPRHGLDVSFFRAYEDGKPAMVQHFFPWNAAGPKENELVFVTGHPGTTNRLETLAKLTHRRDITLPYTLNRLRSLEAALTQYGDVGPEQRRQAATNLHSVANARKASSGQLQGLLDPKIIDAKVNIELSMHPLARGPSNDFTGNPAVIRVADAQKALRVFEKEYQLVETGHAFYSDLFTIARHCVRLNEELRKPTTDRLREYRDSNLASLKFGLYSPAPIEKDLERAKLRASLTFMAETLGGDHPLVTQILGGKNPSQRADELVNSTLYDVATRKDLAEGDAKAIADSIDPLIVLARTVDAEARKLRIRYETEVEEVERQAYAEIAKQKFAIVGKTFAPDATFTLRIAYGTVKGYEVDGKQLPFHTTIASAFQRAEEMKNREPYELPATWLKKKDSLKMATPFNFVSTADTIGGNSGSPVLNAKGELVGINFDRNRHGLVRNFVYTDVQARHIAVHTGVVIEALKTVYEAKELLEELGAM